MDLVESQRERLRIARGRVERVLLLLTVALAVALPLAGPPAWIVRGTLIAITAIGVMGQNLLVGYAGQISFGQAGFLAIGAYAFAHLQGLPWLLALLGAGLVSALAGVVVGFPSLRLKGPYLAIATLGFGIAAYQLLANVPALSGGRMGIAVQRPSLLSLYWTDLGLLALFTLATTNVVASYAG